MVKYVGKICKEEGKGVDYPIAEGDDILAYMQGETVAEKLACFNVLYEMADLMLEDYENSLKTW